MLDVLVVDDSDLIRRMILRTLELAEVPLGVPYEAANGREALDIMEDNWVDLVLADINMPVMDGVEMVRHMRGSPELAGIPVIVVSTEGATARMEELRAMGVSACIRKPFTPEAVSKVVTAMTSEWRRDEHGELLEDVFRTVLERFTFMYGEAAEVRELPGPEGDLMLARITFSGALDGAMELAAPLGLCREMAMNVLGEDSGPDVSTEAAADALGEVLNMACGHIATALTTDAAARVAPPVVVRLPAEHWRRMLDAAGTVGFLVEDRPVLMSLGLRMSDVVA
jgi:two-component system chemotaxis response regulator CheY